MGNPLRALVLGGSGALGQEVCRMLAAAGAQVAFTYCKGEAVAAELERALPGARGMKLDLRRVPEIEEAVDQAARHWGGLDACVHCAAIGVSPADPVPVESHQGMDDVSDAGWDAMLAVNVKSAFFAGRRAARHLRESGGGNLVLVGSVDGVKPVPAPVHYSASKGALVGMTQAMAKELGKHRICVNLVAPGVMDQGLSRSLPKPLLAEYVKHCGLKRAGRPAEIAAVIAWLAQHNTYLTGQTILVDGAL